MYIGIHSLCSILCWSTFGTNYSLKTLGVWCYKLDTLIFGQFLPFFFAGPLKHHQVGWGASVHSHFQISTCSISFKSGLWLGNSRSFAELSCSHSFVFLALCLESLSCWAMNLYPSLRSRALWSRFSSRMSLYIAAFIFPSILTSLQVPATEKHHRSMMLPPPCFTAGIVLARWWTVPGFLQTWRLPFRSKTSIFVSSDQRILFLMI